MKFDRLVEECLTGLLIEANVLPWKEVPEEEKARVWEMISKHNDSLVNDGIKRGEWLIDVTGKHQVYYTFWRYKELDPRVRAYIKNPIYFGNLTTNLTTSVEKAISRAGNVKVNLLTDENRQGMIGRTTKTPAFTFGKYRGKTFPEVYLEDPGYFAWLAKNADEKYAGSKMNLAIGAFAQMYFDDITKKNQEETKTEFVGKVGEVYQGELEIYNVKSVPSSNFSDGYTVFKLKDAQGNRFMTYSLPVDGAEVGIKIKLKGKIKDHKEVLGIKFTRLSNIKIV